MKKMIFFLLATGMVVGMVSPCFSADTMDPIIIDVRMQDEWNDGHMEGAILIPYDLIGEKIGSVIKDKSKRIYVYCRSGRRSKIAKETLDKLGFKDVVDLGALEDAAKTMKRKIIK